MSTQTIKLPTGSTVSVDDHRVRYDLPPASAYHTISSAILNGGCQTFSLSSSNSSSMHVINHKVPPTYDGLNPNPATLLANFASKEGLDPSKVGLVGLLTAASMKTFATASRSAQGIFVDVIVTTGLSNSRAAGAEADYFVLDEGDNDDGAEIKPGTINTVVITNASLTPGALVEAYAIAIEAKCGDCTDHGVCCAKEPTMYAQGTGTDCCVLLSPADMKRVIKHSGKHTLFAEMVGQAVHEATSEAIMINIRYLYGNYAMYTMRRWAKAFISTLKGARPCVPPRPMMPVPSAPASVVGLGIFAVSLAFLMPVPYRARVLLGAVAWDRYIREPPLKFHPVVLAGTTISSILARIPERVFNDPFLGFVCGLLLLMSMLAIFIPTAWLFLEGANGAAGYGIQCVTVYCPSCEREVAVHIFSFMAWILEVMLVKSTIGLQLLCTIALQMAKFLERKQIDEARAQLSWLCSRDPSKLDAGELAGGTLESLSENLSDGFVAPLFWCAFLGPLGALGYRIINTLDSRIGYRGKYEWFGKPSARFDDLVNLIPARITSILLTLAAVFVPGCSAAKGITTAWSDRRQCESPNAGWPMATMAGLLSVSLKKSGEYCLGTGNVPGPLQIRSGHRVAQIAGGITLMIAVVATSIRVD